MNKEHKTPCICNTCLRARDNEIKRVRENMIKVIEETQKDILEMFKKGNIMDDVIADILNYFEKLIKALKDNE